MSSPPELPGGNHTLVLRGARSLKGKGVEIMDSSTEDDTEAQLQEEYWKAETTMPKMPSKVGGGAHPARADKAETNFFKIGVDFKAKLYKYSITLDKVGDKVPTNRDYKRKLVRMIFEHSDSKPQHDKWASDYETLVISAGELFPNSLVPNFDFKRITTGAGESEPGKLGRVRFTCAFRFLGEVDLHGLDEMFTKGVNFQGLEDVIRALNIVSWKHIRDKNKDGTWGGIFGSRFFPSESVKKGAESSKIHDNKAKRLFVIREGFFSSIRPGQQQMLLNVKPVISAFFAPIPLELWIIRKWELGQGRYPTSKEFERELRGVRVWFRHDSQRHSRAIWSLGQAMNQQMFKKKTNHSSETLGSSITVFAHMSSQYKERGINFKPMTRCVNVGNAAHPNWLPIDCLTICDWQIVKTAMKEAPYIDEMLKMSKRPYESKLALLTSAREHLGLISGNGPQDTFYKDFGITPNTELSMLTPKKCPPPKILCKNKGKQETRIAATDSWNLKDKIFHQQAKSYKGLLVISFPVKDAHYETWLNKLNGALIKYGVTAEGSKKEALIWKKIAKEFPSTVKERSVQYREFVCSELTAIFELFGKNRSKDEINSSSAPVLIILPSKMISLYSDVKWWGDCVAGVPTICITHNKMKDDSEDMMANICLKFNMKLQGSSHKVLPSVSLNNKTNVVPNGTMVVGADVTHPGPFSDGCPSIAAIVATTNEEAYHFLGSARLQKSKGEHIEDLQGMIKERFLAWYHAKKSLPTNVLFYRDGVSESQYGKVLHDELPQIEAGYRAACQNLDRPAPAEINLKITFVVVTKRHHARFYPEKDPPENQKSSKTYPHNFPAGTIVDTDVVAPNKFNFYLQSHASPLGTAKSAHYIVLHDDAEYKLKELQERTNNLCYISARATKALSVCAPARYADILCDRLRCYMRLALDKTITVRDPSVFEELGNPSKPSDWANNVNIWSQDLANGRLNPWHPNMDDIMFYL